MNIPLHFCCYHFREKKFFKMETETDNNRRVQKKDSSDINKDISEAIRLTGEVSEMISNGYAQSYEQNNALNLEIQLVESMNPSQVASSKESDTSISIDFRTIT